MRKDGQGHGDDYEERSPRATTAFAIIVPVFLGWMIAGGLGVSWLREAFGF